MSQPPLSPLSMILTRATRRLGNFFHRCESSSSALFLDPGLDYIISRLVHPDVTAQCFKNVYTYVTNRVLFDFEKLLIFTTGEERHLLEYINLLSKTRVPPREIIFVFVNRCTFISRQCFEAHGFLHRIGSIEELYLPAWILDPDLATLELPGSVTDTLIEGGSISVEQVADSITRFPVHDHFSNLYFIGPSSVQIAARLPPSFKSGWTHVIFFDRSCDVVTPLLAPMSYEALVGDVLGIAYGITIAPNDAPVLFAETETDQLRNLPIPEAGEYVERLVQSVRSDMDHLEAATSRTCCGACRTRRCSRTTSRSSTHCGRRAGVLSRTLCSLSTADCAALKIRRSL
jgi:hypothetical protein